jgi:hypothetical protein
LPRGAGDVAKHVCVISACENENPNYDCSNDQQNQGPFKEASPSMRLAEPVQIAQWATGSHVPVTCRKVVSGGACRECRASLVALYRPGSRLDEGRKSVEGTGWA